MIEWMDLVKAGAGALLAIGGFLAKDYWAQRTRPKDTPTLAECKAQHEALHHELRPMRRATIQILLMLKPICDELLRLDPKRKDMDCDALHKCIADLTE